MILSIEHKLVRQMNYEKFIDTIVDERERKAKF